MNIENLKKKGIDYEDGLSRFSGNARLYEKYLIKLLDLTLYNDMKNAIISGDIKTAFEHAHKLKAFIGNLSIVDFYDRIKDLTEILRAGEIRDYTDYLVKLDKEYESILQAIREG